MFGQSVIVLYNFFSTKYTYFPKLLDDSQYLDYLVFRKKWREKICFVKFEEIRILLIIPQVLQH